MQLMPTDPFIALLRNDLGAKIGVTPVKVPTPPQPPANGAGQTPNPSPTPFQRPVSVPPPDMTRT